MYCISMAEGGTEIELALRKQLVCGTWLCHVIQCQLRLHTSAMRYFPQYGCSTVKDLMMFFTKVYGQEFEQLQGLVVAEFPSAAQCS